ncbi:MAG: hypothetical protein K6V36_04475 [Anaerolineae bacterium]|nr:hypothetical protein [Anaerolineae bacterium]
MAEQWLILAVIATPLLVLARDACNRRHRRKDVLLALGVLLAILVNAIVVLRFGR